MMLPKTLRYALLVGVASILLQAGIERLTNVWPLDLPGPETQPLAGIVTILAVVELPAILVTDGVFNRNPPRADPRWAEVSFFTTGVLTIAPIVWCLCWAVYSTVKL